MTNQTPNRQEVITERIYCLEKLLSNTNIQKDQTRKVETAREIVNLYQEASTSYLRKDRYDLAFQMDEKAGKTLELVGETLEAAKLYARSSRKFINHISRIEGIQDYPAYSGPAPQLTGLACAMDHRAYNLLVNRLNAQSKNGDYNSAVKTNLDLIRICRTIGWDNEIPTLIELRATLLEKAGKPEEARKIYTNLARRYTRKDQTEEASKMWERAGDLKNAARVWENKRGYGENWIKAAALRERAGDYEKAAEDYSQMILHESFEDECKRKDKVIEMLQKAGKQETAIQRLIYFAEDAIRQWGAYGRADKLRARAEKLKKDRKQMAGEKNAN